MSLNEEYIGKELLAEILDFPKVDIRTCYPLLGYRYLKKQRGYTQDRYRIDIRGRSIVEDRSPSSNSRRQNGEKLMSSAIVRRVRIRVRSCDKQALQ